MHTYRITLGATLISLVHGFVIAPRGVSGLLTRVNGLGEVSPAKRSPKDLTREGMSLFREGKVADSASVFDQVLDADSRSADCCVSCFPFLACRSQTLPTLGTPLIYGSAVCLFTMLGDSRRGPSSFDETLGCVFGAPSCVTLVLSERETKADSSLWKLR